MVKADVIIKNLNLKIMKNLSAIVCVNLRNAIGSKTTNDLLYKIKEDLQRFKVITTGHTIVMGMNTFKSLRNKPLPNRLNFVLSQNPEIPRELLNIENLRFSELETSIEDSLKQFENEEEVFIIGGAQIYEQTIDLVDKIYFTLVFDRAPTVPSEDLLFFPFNLQNYLSLDDYKYWTIVDQSLKILDEKSGNYFQFITLKRR
jgi:dihydrofolate reductase